MDIEKFEITKRIGTGVYGVVFSANVLKSFSTTKHDFKVGERVAIKKFMVDDRDEGVTSDTVREIDILNRLSHKNVVSAYDTMETVQNERCINVSVVLPLAMMSLDSYILQRLPEPQYASPKIKRDVVYILYQILCGVFYLHTNFIIHNDLKPANILMFKNANGKFYPKIADFGISRVVEGMENIKGVSQTQWWRPPELLVNINTRFSYETDMWALGIIFYEVITKDLPVKNEHESEQLKEINTFLKSDWEVETGRLFSGRYRGIQDLIIKLLDPDPKTRITASEALQTPVFSNFECPAVRLENIPWNIKLRITPDRREKVIRWMEETCRKMNDKRLQWEHVFFLSVDIFDRFMSTDKGKNMEPDQYQLIASSSLSLASKIFPEIIFGLHKLHQLTGEEIDKIISMECKIFRELKWILFRPTVQLLFPNAPVEKLIACYIQNPVPDEIGLCISTKS